LNTSNAYFRSRIILLSAACADPTKRYTPSQADVACFKAIKSVPDSSKYPHAARWYKHIASFEDEFATLPGDVSKAYAEYGPEVAEVATTGAAAPAAAAKDDDDDEDLFGSDEDEEEDPEVVRLREERLAAYRAKKAAKPKAAAKSLVILDVKPWGEYPNDYLFWWA
jgi:elongation factor 1-beta